MLHMDATNRRNRQHRQVQLAAIALGDLSSMADGMADSLLLQVDGLVMPERLHGESACGESPETIQE